MEPEAPKKRRRGVYLLPNLFTTFGMFAGFFAIIAASKGNFTYAAIAVIVAMVIDGIDGRIARMTNTQTEFGAQYDSLSDMVSFGIAPALVMFHWSLSLFSGANPEGAPTFIVTPDLSKVGWLAAFFYAAMAALRLARFNVNIDKVEKKYFMGLASPAAATLLVSFVWLCQDMGWTGQSMRYYALVLTVFAGTMMISPIFYTSFKERNREGRIPFSGALLIVLLVVLVTLYPPVVFFLVFLAYALSGPVMALHRWRQKMILKRKGLWVEEGEQSSEEADSAGPADDTGTTKPSSTDDKSLDQHTNVTKLK
jgi:CDP-diacylglycerol--serine O-phosphatidyltransferase